VHIKEVTHERVRQLKQFEPVRISLTALLFEGDDLREVLDTLKREAEAFLYPTKSKDIDDKPQPGIGITEDDLPY
jgi:hypothetical protein